MATSSNEAKVRFVAETTEFNSAIKAANQQMSELRSEMKLAEAQFKNNATSVEALTEKKRILSQQLEASAQKVEALKGKLEAAKSIYGENSEEVSKLKTQLNNAETQYVNLGNEIEDCNRQLDDSADQIDDVTDSVDDLTTSTESGSTGWTTYKGIIADLASTALKELVNGLKEVAKYVIDTGKDFDSGMSQVQATSGATTGEMEKLEAKAKEMGKTTKFTATDAADAFNYMAMAGWDAGEMIDGIDGIMNLAAASGADLATTSDIVTDALTAMGYSAEDAGRLADVMAAAASNSNTNVEQMGATFKYAAPIAGTLGISMEDLAVATGLMANAGIKGEQAGTSLRAGLLNLVSPSTEAATYMDQLGISVTNSDGSMKSLAEIMETLRLTFGNLTEAEQAEAAAAIFGKEASSGWLAVINASDDDFNTLTTAINGSTGAAESMATTMQDNLQGDITLLSSAAEGLALKLYDKLEPILRSIVQFATDSLIPLIDGLLDNLPTVGTVIAGIIATIVAYKWTSIITFIGNAGTAIAGLFKTLVSNPIGLVVMAVAGLASGLVYLCTRSSEAEQAIEANAEAVTSFNDAISNSTPDITHATDILSQYGHTVSELDSGIQTAENEITNIISTALSEQRQLRDDEIESISQYNEQIAALEAEKVNTYRQSMVIEQMKISQESGEISQESMAQYVVNLQQGLSEANAASEESYNQRLAQIYNFHQAQGTLDTEAYYADIAKEKAAYEEELAVNQSYYAEGMAMLTENVTQTINAEEHKWSEVAAAQGEGKSAYENTLAEMDQDTTNAFVSMYTETVNAGGEISEETQQLALDIVASFDDLPDNMQEAGDTAMEGITQGIEGGIGELESATHSADVAVKDKMTEDFGITSGGGSSSFGKGVGRYIAEGLAEGLESSTSELTSATKSMTGTVTNTTTSEFQEHSPSKVFKVIGNNVAEGLAVGIEDKQSSLGSRVASFANSLVSRIKKTFGVASPSKVMAEIGGYLTEGLGVGIEDNADAALNPMRNLANEITGNGLNAHGSIDYQVNSSLGDFVSSAIGANSPFGAMGSMIDAIEDLASRAIELNIDSTRIATATASASDTVSGNRLNLKNRGVAL